MTAPLLVFAAFGLLRRFAAAAVALQQDQCTGDNCDGDEAFFFQKRAAAAVASRQDPCTGDNCDNDEAFFFQQTAGAAVASRQDQCTGDHCHTDETFLMQTTMNRVKTDVAEESPHESVAKSHEECYPCSITQECPGRPNLRMDIYMPQEPAGDGPYPVVIAHHGSKGKPKNMEKHCIYVIAPAGFVCAAITPVEQDPKFFADDAIEYFMNHPEYKADPDMVILYGHSKGGRGVFEYMFRTEMPTRSNVKGFIQDCSSASSSNFNWKKKDANDDYLKFPPLLMLHCEGDQTVPKKRTISKTIPKIDSANEERGPDEQIIYHYIEFKKDTGCDHSPLLINSWDGAQAAVTMINGIVAGEENPFVGLPEEVSGKGQATKSRRRRGEPNWTPPEEEEPEDEPEPVLEPELEPEDEPEATTTTTTTTTTQAPTDEPEATTTTTTTTTTQAPTGGPYFQDLDVSYGSHSKQKVDVYWPQDAQLKPSGGWSAVIITPGDGLDRKGLKGFCTEYMVPSGRLCVAADYRQSDADRDGDMFDMAMWFYSKASTWDVDQTNIVLGGQSLGGLTINNVIWNKNMGKKLLSGSPAKIRAVLLLSGTRDGHKRQARKAKYFPASTYICSSDTDTTVPYQYSKNLWKELDKLGEPVKFVTIADAGHSIWYSDKKEDWYAEILTFLDETVP